MSCSAMQVIRRVFVFCGAVGVSWTLTAGVFPAEPLGTPSNPIIDSAMSEKEAFDGLSAECPISIRQRQRLIDVVYYSFDEKMHRGQLVIDKDLVADVQHVFEVARDARFPHRPRRPGLAPSVPRERRLERSSVHGRQQHVGVQLPIDGRSHGPFVPRLWPGHRLNPLQNPYLKGKVVLPPGAAFDPAVKGTLSENHPVVRAFLERGWQWGGHWKTLKDYQHFQKP
jgi:peptidoglycan L-alanyl-D-glutamate endopeptidase CwlK